MCGRRKAAVVVLVLGIWLIALAVALNVGWILLNLREVALLVFGIIFFALIITGLVLNTIFLIREIRRNEQHDAFLNAVTHELKTPIASIQTLSRNLENARCYGRKTQRILRSNAFRQQPSFNDGRTGFASEPDGKKAFVEHFRNRTRQTFERMYRHYKDALQFRRRD